MKTNVLFIIIIIINIIIVIIIIISDMSQNGFAQDS